VVTDSIACLPKELIDQYAIEILPINFYVSGRLYRDWVDVTPSEAYELFLKDPETFKSSAPSPEECLHAYRNASRIARNILCVTLSTKLSSTYDVAIEARELAKTALPDVTIAVLDSESATPSEGFVALAAARAAQEGKSLPETIQAAQRVKEKVSSIVILDTIRHVYRSGRVPKIASQIGSILNIRPILTVSGTVHFSGAVRSRSHGIERAFQMMRKRIGQKPAHIAVFHAYAPEEAQKLKERAATEFNCVELWLSEFSPIMGYACGTGTVGIAFYAEE